MSNTYRTIPDWAKPGTYFYESLLQEKEGPYNRQPFVRNKYINGRDGVVGDGVSDGHGPAPRKGWKEIGPGGASFYKRYASKRDRKLAAKEIEKTLKEFSEE